MSVGVFDSGVGGLSILRALAKAYPQEHFIYLGDTARLPYGTKSQETIKKYVQRNAGYLKSQHSIKNLIVACNSASSVLNDVELPVKTLGVIQAGSLDAVEKSQNGNLGLWATRATVESEAYTKALKSLAPSTQLTPLACSLLVSLVEEDLSPHPLLEPSLNFYLDEILKKNPKIDTLILGCTHFPFFKQELQKVIQERGLSIQLAEASQKIISEIKTQEPISENRPQNKILITDDASHFKDFIKRSMPSDWTFSIEKVDI